MSGPDEMCEYGVDVYDPCRLCAADDTIEDLTAERDALAARLDAAHAVIREMARTWHREWAFMPAANRAEWDAATQSDPAPSTPGEPNDG